MSQQRTATTIRRPRRASRASRGMVLVTTLLVMIVLTLLGTAAVFTSNTDLSIAGNGRSDLHALSMAEAGVHEALARVNMKGGAEPTRLIPGPNPDWERTIVNKETPGASEVQSLTGDFDSATVLPVSTTVKYKREDANEKPVPHCNGPCDGDVVRYHTNFGYAGTGVATGAALGQPFLEVRSTYDAGATATRKEVAVELVAGPMSVRTRSALQTCQGIGKVQSVARIVNSHGPAITMKAGPSSVDWDGISEADHTSGGVVEYDKDCGVDPFHDTFGMTKAQLKAAAQAQGILLSQAHGATAPTAATSRGKVIWVTGNADYSAGHAIGSPTAPLVLVVEGKLDIQGNMEIYGLIYVKTLNVQGNAKVHGAIVAEGQVTSVEGNSRIEFDPNVMGNLPGPGDYKLTSWKVS